MQNEHSKTYITQQRQRSICLCYLCEELSGYVGDVVVSVNRVDERDSKHASQEIFRHQTI